VVVCLEQGADLHMAQLMPLPLTVSCFSKIQIGFTFLVPAYLGSPGKGLLNGCVCVCLVISFAWYAETRANQSLGSAKPGHIEPSDRSAAKKTDDCYHGEVCPC